MFGPHPKVDGGVPDSDFGVPTLLITVSRSHWRIYDMSF
jgi:hypothetical protein